MLKKSLMFAITSGLTAKLRMSYAGQKRRGGVQARLNAPRRSMST